MKRVQTTLLVLCLLLPCLTSGAQENTWPEKTSTVSLYVSTLGLVSPVNLSCERLYHLGWFHIGYTSGLTFAMYDEFRYYGLGGHLTFTALTGKKNHHFEVKTGVALLPFGIEGRSSYSEYFWLANPVITLGYRYEKPDGLAFFRMGLGTGGIGMGAGIRLE